MCSNIQRLLSVMPAGIAANHPATAEVGLRVLDTGGSAADAAVAATLACCVAESVVTGVGGGGFATYFDAATGTVTCLDFFCAVPGINATTPPAPMTPIDVTFGHIPQVYSIGAPSVAVPGVIAGLAGVHSRWGRLAWPRVVEPAIGLARSGVVVPAALARTLTAVHPALTPGPGAAIYSPNGRLLAGGDLLVHPGLADALVLIAETGPAAFYTGPLGDLCVRVVQDGGGVLTRDDLRYYRVTEAPVHVAAFAGRTVHGRRDLADTIGTLADLPELRGMPPGPRAVALARGLLRYGPERIGDTSNISVVDAAGNACVITLTLGLGSGVWLPGLGVHLNSMLGEGELQTGVPQPGDRMSSMMCPLVVLDRHGRLELAIGSSGASRIRTALVHSLTNILVGGRPVDTAIADARFHPVIFDGRPVIHCEPGRPEADVTALTGAGFAVNQWSELDAYFGGVSAVGAAGAGADPRRGGVGLLA
jgi:gamma-glutamyltranspeptidase/glutathione hydrolase